MNDTILLESENFRLSLDFQVFESDISYPSNTILSVSVSSEGFSASTTMDIDIKDIPIFCNELQKTYDSLKGRQKFRNLTVTNSTFYLQEIKKVISLYLVC